MAKFLTLAQLQKEFGITMRSLRELMQREIYEPVKGVADQAKAIADGVRRDADEGKFKGDPGDTGPQGEPGAPGQDGQDGHTPVITAARAQNRLIIIADGRQVGYVQDGTNGAKGKDGEDGADGADGFSPIVTIEEGEGERTLTIEDAVGEHSTVILDGAKGDPGEVTEEELTAALAPKADMTAVAISTGREFFTFTSGGYVDCSGETADITAVTASGTYAYTVIPCETGDIFIVTGRQSNVSPYKARLWAFIDENGNVLETTKGRDAVDSSRYNDVKLVAPHGSTKLVINAHESEKHYVYRIVEPDGYRSLALFGRSAFKGSLTSSGGVTRTSLKNRVNCGRMKLPKGSRIRCRVGKRVDGFAVYEYDSAGEYIKRLGGITNPAISEVQAEVDGYYVITVNYAEEPADENVIFDDVDIFTPDGYVIEKSEFGIRYELGSLGTNGRESSSTARVRTAEYIRAKKGDTIFCADANFIITAIYEYSQISKRYYKKTEPGIGISIYTVPQDCLIRVVVGLKSASGASSSAISAYLPIIGNAVEFTKTSGEWKPDIPDYYREGDYITGKIDSICSHVGANDSFIFFTDAHWDDNYGRSPELIQYIRDHTPVKRVVFGGDSITKYTDSKISAIKGLAEFREMYGYARGYDWLPVLGNHEFNDPGASATALRLSSGEAYASLVKENEHIFRCINDYLYCVDNPAQKLRTYYLGCKYSSQIDTPVKKDLFADMEGTGSGWSVLVVSHVGVTWDDASSTIVINDNFTAVANALDALKAKDSLTYDGVTYDYSGTDVAVIGAITGHYHIDADVLTDGGVRIISTTCDSRLESSKSALTRTLGTISENAFDVVQIDTTEKKIYMTRIGAGEDREFSYE